MIPVIGVIEPGARAAAKASRSGKIGVIGTEATIASGAYTRAIQAARPRFFLHPYPAPAPAGAPVRERASSITKSAEKKTSVYYPERRAFPREWASTCCCSGCTHYPLLRPLFQRVMGPGVKIIDSAIATAEAVRERLAALGIGSHSARGSRSFFVTEMPDRFVRVGRQFFGPEVESAVRIER